MLAPALRRDIGHGSLKDLQEGLLDALAGDVPRDGWIFGLARDLVDLVDVNDPSLCPLHIVVCDLQQSKNDVLHVLPDISRLGEGSGIGDSERHVQDLSQGLRQQGLATSGWTDEENI